MILPFIKIKKTKEKGLGVFTNEDIPKNTLIEIAPVIVLTKKEKTIIHNTQLHDYYFLWGEKQEQAAIALGYASIYNHSYQPNCTFECNFEMNRILIISYCDIKEGNELTIDYTYNSDITLWFEVK